MGDIGLVLLQNRLLINMNIFPKFVWIILHPMLDKLGNVFRRVIVMTGDFFVETCVISQDYRSVRNRALRNLFWTTVKTKGHKQHSSKKAD